MRTFQRGETIICTRNVQTAAGVYVSPDTSFVLTIYAPSGAKVVDNKDMLEDEEGKFHYDYKPLISAEQGTYTVYYTAVDEGRTTIYKAPFGVEA